MEYNLLPDTDIKVSKICLGTMTWGRQNNEVEGHTQMNFALDQGVNFFDTAELYPIPPRKEEQGNTERFIGTWFKKTGNREKVILASKIAGPAAFTKHIRSDKSFSKDSIDSAIEASLKRLQTDYIDLYQVHWPERNTNYFGKRGHKYEKGEVWEENFEVVLDALNANVIAGNIRHIGLSNETPWGLMRYLQAENENRPKMRTIQNPYSLLNRTFEAGNSEVCHRENVGLLAYSPLAFGVLSGKYRHGNQPKDGRITLFPNYNRYSNTQCNQAVDMYYDLATANGMTLTQMALAFVNERPFVTSNIIGATSLKQLKENIDSSKIKLSLDILTAIDKIQELVPNPAP
ncbi:MAG: aryl-alcohol dehydrogenase-like predicted oxidoreductase [Flavobacteriaceae bacterium]|jgi:aryl-alcohol dehydrogenase-like predicted oxidoreductase